MNLRVHGGISDRELFEKGIAYHTLIDFSVSTNPYGPCEAVLNAVRTAPVERYPDPTAWPVRQAIALQQGITPDEVVVGNGSCDLLWTIARALVSKGTRVATIEPTFSEFTTACRYSGAELVEWRAQAANDFAIEMGAVASLLKKHSPEILYLCSPNTPTGVSVPIFVISELALLHPNTLFVLDQAFLSLSHYFKDEKTPLPENILCVRSLTKEHAIAGVRIGYLLGKASLTAKLEASRPAWSTSTLAQAAALAAIKECAFVESSRIKMLADCETLRTALKNEEFSPHPTTTAFFLLPVKSGSQAREGLLSRGILVRDCTSFGLPNHLRLCARPEHDMDIFIKAIRKERQVC